MNRTILLFAYTFVWLQVANAQLVSSAAISIKQGTNLVLNNISFQNDGVFNQTEGTVIFSGNAGNSISGAMTTGFHVLRLEKTGGSLQLQRGITVNGELQFDEGLLQLNNNNIVLEPAALLSGESESSHITGASGGFVEITRPLNFPAAENPGNLGAIITAAQDLGPVTIRRGHQSQTNSGGGGSSVLRYYEIIPATNTSLNATLRFNYLDAELNGLDENNLTIWKTGNTGWTDLGRSGSSIALNFVEMNGINDLSRFTLSVPGNALPLIWTSFKTQCLSNQVRISWKTEQEQNTALFTIWRSANGNDWSMIGTVPAAGYSNIPVAYAFVDPGPSPASVYYQVREKDIDGKITVSPVLSTDCAPAHALSVYPNPTERDCFISVHTAAAGVTQLMLYDQKGALVLQRREAVQSGDTRLQLGMAAMSGGTYYLTVKLPDGSVKTVKIEKVRR